MNRVRKADADEGADAKGGPIPRLPTARRGLIVLIELYLTAAPLLRVPPLYHRHASKPSSHADWLAAERGSRPAAGWAALRPARSGPKEGRGGARTRGPEPRADERGARLRGRRRQASKG